MGDLVNYNVVGLRLTWLIIYSMKYPSLIYTFKGPPKNHQSNPWVITWTEIGKKPSVSIIKSINIMRHNLILHYFLFPLLISSRPRERNQVYFVRSDVISTESFNTEIIKYYQKNLYVLIIYITMMRLIQESKTTLRPTIRYAG